MDQKKAVTFAVSYLIGGWVGYLCRRRLYEAGCVKSMWYGLPRKKGTYRLPLR